MGVGSVCKRQTNPEAIRAVLEAVSMVAPDWRLHGFGVKTSALRSGKVSSLLHSVDSMAWSFRARYQRWEMGPDWPVANSPEVCLQWLAKMENIEPMDQLAFFPVGVMAGE